jgi:putative ribosome biogenesis GTPase RsgA
MERHKNSAELNENGQGMLMRKKQWANAPQENPTNLKLVMVGLGGVGKSSLTIQASPSPPVHIHFWLYFTSL